MGRTTVLNDITSEDKLKLINKKNMQLKNDFLDYLISVDRAGDTLEKYANNLDIFFCWNLEFNDNKFFIEITKREFTRFQSHTIKEWKWSPNRIRTVKSTLSSLSNYIENILDEEPEFKGYKNQIKKIESPVKTDVREKSVLSEDQVKSLLDRLVADKKYDKACALALAAFSGRRKSELLRFKTSFFTDENVIYGSLYKSPEKIVTKGKGSRGKLLTVYTLKIPFKPYFDLWMDYRKENGVESEWLFPLKKNGKYVDEPMRVSTLDSWAETFTRLIEVPFYWHCMRHHFTTSLAKSNLPDNVIKNLVGWESLEMVSIYKDIDADEEFGKYFSEEGITQVEVKSLSEL